ncbi:MAG: hypothetical protein JWN41_810 [Thermoleophilia bacterium]|nr:hypothetical protein [Thermoleophilia bacterium]
MQQMAATAQRESDTTRPRAWRFAAVFAITAASIGLAWWITGPAPVAADAGLSATPPPMTVPVGVATDQPLARAIRALTAKRFKTAEAAFTTLVAESPDDAVAQTGLILSGWRSHGPSAVEHDLAQLAREQPDSAHVALQLGLVRVVTGDTAGAEASFHRAVLAGRAAADSTSLRMARLADDLLHPQGFRSYVPVLVQPVDVPVAERATLRRLLVDIQREDRTAAAREARRLATSRSGMARLASIVGRYEKGDENKIAGELDALSRSSAQPAAARSRALLHEGLVRLWSGADRDAGCDVIGRAASPTSDSNTRTLASSIFAELCR